MRLKKILVPLLLVSLLFACKSKREESENSALEKLIQLDTIPLFQILINNPKDTQYIPISNKYKTQLSCVESDNLKILAKYIDTTQLINYSTNLKHTTIETSFKYFSNVRLYDSTQTQYYLTFSKPLFFGKEYCYIEVDFQGISGKGYLYLLTYTNDKWTIILKRPTWVS
jgi:hypothetical protein